MAVILSVVQRSRRIYYELMTSIRHIERSFCEPACSRQGRSIYWKSDKHKVFNCNRSFNSILFVPHKTSFRMTLTKLQIDAKIKVVILSVVQRSW